MTSPPTAPNDYSTPRTQEECDALDHGRVMIQMYLDPKAVKFDYSWGSWKVEDYRDLRTGLVERKGRVRKSSFETHEQALDYIGRLVEERKLIGFQPMTADEQRRYDTILEKIASYRLEYLGVRNPMYDGIRVSTSRGEPRRPFSCGLFWYANDFGRVHLLNGEVVPSVRYQHHMRTFSKIDGLEKFVDKLPNYLPKIADFDMYTVDIQKVVLRISKILSDIYGYCSKWLHHSYDFPFPQLDMENNRPVLRYEGVVYYHRDPVVARMVEYVEELERLFDAGHRSQRVYLAVHDSTRYRA